MELQNERWLEDARENLEEALDNGDWSTSRAIIEDMESKGFDASHARRMMNLAMNDFDDIDEENIEVAPGVYQSKKDVDNNNRVDEARGN